MGCMCNKITGIFVITQKKHMKPLLLMGALLVLAGLLWWTVVAEKSVTAASDRKQQNYTHSNTAQTPASTGTGFFIIDSFSGML